MKAKNEEVYEYRNKSVINQRGGSIEINNSTNREEIKISQHSGSNISLNNATNSELATNNKQTIVLRDEFKTVKNNLNTYVGKDRNIRVEENNFELKGISNQSQIDAYNQWKESYRDIANVNSQFKLLRGGASIPNTIITPITGTRGVNPVIGSSVQSVENTFNGYKGIPLVNSANNEVLNYNKVTDRGKTTTAQNKNVTLNDDIKPACGLTGSSAPGVVEFGGELSPATENGDWLINDNIITLPQKILNKQENELNTLEQQMGNGGDDIEFVKRHKIEIIGATENDYPSLRVDPKGRSQPFEMVVGKTSVFKNHDYIPHVEEINNSNNFPCGDYSLSVGNKWNVLVGSGGIQIKTSGTIEIGTTMLKIGSHKTHLHSKYGTTIASDSHVEIASPKSIQLRCDRQVLVENSLGVKNNVIIGGGLFVEGEVYVNHITAPTEVQETENTLLYGKFNTTTNRSLLIGEALIGGTYYPVFAIKDNNLIQNYPHSHHFNNVPLRLLDSNKQVREIAQAENINKHNVINVSREQQHEHKGKRAI